MKNLFRLLGGTLILLAIVLFLYGSVKTYRASEEQSLRKDFGDGIVLVEKGAQETFAGYSFTAAVVSGVLGLVVCLLGAGDSKKKY